MHYSSLDIGIRTLSMDNSEISNFGILTFKTSFLSHCKNIKCKHSTQSQTTVQTVHVYHFLLKGFSHGVYKITVKLNETKK